VDYERFMQGRIVDYDMDYGGLMQRMDDKLMQKHGP